MRAASSLRVETFAFFCGIAYLAIGLLGLMPQAVHPPSSNSPPVNIALLHGYLLGLFPVNIVHNGIHIAIGAWGIVAGRSVASPKFYARTVAVAFATLAVLGLIPGLDTLFGLVPLHGYDVWLHAATAAVAIYFGWHPSASIERRGGDSTDRRQRVEPVEQERRSGHGDRRLPGSEI